MGLEEVYIGIDLEDAWAQISYLTPGMDAPQTVSLVAGEEHYRIPTSLRQPQGQGAWYLGDARDGTGDGFYVDHLWEACRQGKQVMADRAYGGEELFLLYLRKALRLVPGLADLSAISALTFHLPKITLSDVQLLRRVGAELGIAKEKVFLQDDAESFCHFAMHQEEDLMRHDVALFCCEADTLLCYYLRKEETSSPKRVSVKRQELGTLPEEPLERDAAFGEMAENLFQGRVVSGVYLMGTGFEGGWLGQALHVLCRGRRAFQGKNLFAVGACYGSYLTAHSKEGGYVFFGENKLADNVLLKVRNGERSFFVDLAEAGANRYELKGSCQVLLSGDPSVEVWLRAPDSGQARTYSLQLPGLPRRPDKATRLLVEALPSDRGELRIRITDMGLGAWYASSGKVWEYQING